MKYIYKYITKGVDMLAVDIGENQEVEINEIKEYQDSRFISPIEACWRIFKFEMHGQTHVVERLPIHIENGHQVYFAEDLNNGKFKLINFFNSADEMREVLMNSNTSKLTAFFSKCATDEDARTLLYHEFPKKYTWIAKDKCWKKRERGGKNIIGRMYFANPSEGERFYLRLLLCYVRGPTSFQNLRTFEGVIYNTFKEACNARGYLESDAEWISCLADAAVSGTAFQLRQLFSTVLIFGSVQNVGDLYNMYFNNMSEDFRFFFFFFFLITLIFPDIKVKLKLNAHISFVSK